MAEIPASNKKIYEEEVNYKAPVSEATFTKVGGAINYVISNASDYVGQLESTMLTEAQFATTKDYDYTETDLTVKKWVLVDGQNITGSDYATLTGLTALPSARSNGAFPRQAVSEANIGTYESNQNKSHVHQQSFLNDGSSTQYPARRGTNGGAESYYRQNTGTGFTLNQALLVGPLNTQSEGGTEARPNAFQVNYFLRINA